MAGEVRAHCNFGGREVYTVHLTPADPISANILELKQQTMAFMSTYLAAHNLDTKEVDVMEEVVSDDDDKEGSRKKKNKKRKR